MIRAVRTLDISFSSGCGAKLDVVFVVERSAVTSHYVRYIRHFLVQFSRNFRIGTSHVRDGLSTSMERVAFAQC